MNKEKENVLKILYIGVAAVADEYYLLILAI